LSALGCIVCIKGARVCQVLQLRLVGVHCALDGSANEERAALVGLGRGQMSGVWEVGGVRAGGGGWRFD